MKSPFRDLLFSPNNILGTFHHDSIRSSKPLSSHLSKDLKKALDPVPEKLQSRDKILYITSRDLKFPQSLCSIPLDLKNTYFHPLAH